MAEIERIALDFTGDGILEAAQKLEDILCSGHWSDRTLNYEDERTGLLLRLLQIGGIAVYKRGYNRKKDTPEIRRRAGEFNMYMNKRNVSQSLLDIAGIFSTHEYDGAKTEYNSLFFPELKAYVRCGGMPPDRLLGLLERDECEAVMLFPDYIVDGGDAFFAFTFTIPKAMYLDALDEMRGRITEEMFEAAKKADEKLGQYYPDAE